MRVVLTANALCISIASLFVDFQFKDDIAHLSHWLKVSDCGRWMSVLRRATCVVYLLQMFVVRRQQLLQRTSHPKLQAGF